MCKPGNRILAGWLFAFCLVSLLAAPAAAQLDTGAIVGTVRDSSGAVVPGALVKITNLRTGRVWELVTGGLGEYATPPLPSGPYQVEVSREGFKTAVVTDIIVYASAVARADATLDVGQAQETITVVAGRSTVDTITSDLATTVDTNRVLNLPLNGRDFTTLLTLSPGSVTTAGFGQTSLGGFETSLAGINILLDGADATRIDVNATSTQLGRQDARISRASVESVQEFRVLEGTYSAEYGRSMGGVVNVITKSGGNELHGSVFEYFRHNALDARNFFAREEVPLRLHQFGANLSGPIVRDKLFFFVNYEGVRQRVESPVEVQVLNAAYRALAVPSMRPVIDAIPVGNGGPVLDSGGNPTPRDYYFGTLENKLREDTGSVKLDWVASASDTLSVRYNINDNFTHTQYGVAEGQISPSRGRNQLAKLTWTRTLTPTLLNEAGFAFNRPRTDSLGGGGDFPIFQCFFCDETNNFGVAPGPALFSTRSPQYSIQALETVSWIAGRHSIRFGADIRYNSTKRELEPQRFLSYAGAGDFVNNAGFSLSTLGFTMVGLNNTNWNFFFQDSIRLTPTFTVNVGLRYEYNSVLRSDEIGNFDIATLTLLPTGQPLYQADRNNFAPRIGLSWDPFGRGKTVIRSGFGIFYNPLLTGAGLSLAQNNQPNFSINIFELLFGTRVCTPPLNIAYPLPATLPVCTPELPRNVNSLDRDMRDTYAMHWSLNVQHELFANTVVELGYVGNRGVKLPAGASSAGLELNRDPWLYSPLLSDAYGNIRRLGNFLSSEYNAMQLSVRRRVAGGLNVDANYTWAHQFDNAVNIFSAFQNSSNPSADWSEGDIDVRHNFTLGMVYDLPAASWLPPRLGKGWQISSLFQARSALPFNISVSAPFLGLDLIRPNRVPGQNIRPANYSVPDNQLNPAAFVAPGLFEYGNLRRNAGRGPGFHQLDLSLAKTTPITERVSFQIRAELFNLFNHPNFANPVGVLTDTNFGRSLSTVGNLVGVGTARQAQFVFRVTY